MDLGGYNFAYNCTIIVVGNKQKERGMDHLLLNGRLRRCSARICIFLKIPNIRCHLSCKSRVLFLQKALLTLSFERRELQ